MGFSKRYKKQKGGTAHPLTGLDVKSIATFSPASVQDLVLWIKGDNSLIKREAVRDYANAQLPMIKLALLDDFSSRLQAQVITEIRSAAPDAPNSLVRLELAEDMSTTFPKLYTPKEGYAGIDLSAYQEPSAQTPIKVTLMTKEPIELPDDYSSFLDGENIETVYNTTLDRFLISAQTVQQATPIFETNADGETVQKPSALLREFLVYGRKLTTAEQQTLEGYIAYKTNTQFNLPADHPYLPDTSADPVLKPILDRMKLLLDTLAAAVAKAEANYSSYVQKAGTGEAVEAEYGAAVGRAKEVAETLKGQRGNLSRAVLKARAAADGNYSLEDVRNNWEGAANYDSTIAAGEAVLNSIRTLLPKLETGDQVAAARQISLSVAEAEAERGDAATEERLREIEGAAERRAAIGAEIAIREEIRRLGSTLLNSHVSKFHEELDLCCDSFSYLIAQQKRGARTLEGQFNALKAPFESGTWVEPFSFLDSGKTPAGAYRDPTLQTLYQTYQAIRSAATENDCAYLASELLRLQREATALCARWKQQRSLALFKTLYVGHLQMRYERAEQMFKQWEERVEELQTAMGTFAQDLKSIAAYKEGAPKPISLAMRTFLPLKPTFFASIGSTDAALLAGFTHVETDEKGVPKTATNAAGEVDVLFFHPERLAAAYSLESGYAGQQQLYKQVPLQASAGLLPLLPISRFRKPVSMEAPAELPRDATNSVVQVRPNDTSQQVSLPKYAVVSGAFYVIQNVGQSLPLTVRNPGALEDAVDLLGPGEVGVYMYGEGTSLSSTPGFAYGMVDWIEGLLPYDTLLGCPRSKFCVYVTELRTHIYCLKTGGAPRPLLDSDGAFVPVYRAENGTVYDLDDSALSNPYAVQTLPEMNLELLDYDRVSRIRKVRSRRPADPLPTLRDETTGLLVLCCKPGIPAVDEFGILKVVGSHALWNGEGPRVKGSVEDLQLLLPVSGPLPQNHGARYPKGLQFGAAFRSRFFLEDAGNAQFATTEGLPLLSTEGTGISLPSFAARADEIAKYEEPAGQMNIAFKVSGLAAPSAPGAPVQVAWRDIPAALQTAAVTAKTQQTLSRLTTSAAYMRGTADRLREASQTVLKLGTTITESIRSDISDTIVLVEERLQGFTDVEGTIERLQRVMQVKSVPNEVIVSLGALELKLRDKMLELQTLTSSLQKSLDNYMFLIQRIQTVRDFIARLRADGTFAFTEGFELIQKRFKQIVQETKSISSPELDAITVQLKERETAFKTAQDTLEQRLSTQPEYMSELREWLLDLQRLAADQYAAIESARAIVRQRITARLSEAEEAAVAAKKAEVDTVIAQIQQIQNEVNKIASLFQAHSKSSEPQESGSEPAIGRGPFAHLKTPSLKTDILPLFGDSLVNSFLDAAATVADTKIDVPSDVQLPAARAALQEAQTRYNGLMKALEAPYAAYDAAVAQKVAYQISDGQRLASNTKTIAQELESQRLAAETAAAGRSDLETHLAKIAEVAGTVTQETAREGLEPANPLLLGTETNPFLLEPLYGALRQLEEKGRASEDAMKRAVQNFQTARAKNP
jgi:hypothetical protein